LGYALSARWTAAEGEEENVLAAVSKVIEPSRAEPGCLFYQANRDPDDPRVFFFYEIYRDEAAFAAHTETAHFQDHVIGDALPRLAERERAFYRTIA
jgi:quinol monooxygenase YgiN